MTRHVFICGLHRSGTSLLHSLLASHPHISGFRNTGAPEDEGQHLQSVYPAGRVFGGPGKFCFDPNAQLTELSPLVTERNRQILSSEWSRYWDTRKPVLLEKSPPNIIRSRFLQAMFPESQFVFIVRHPIAVSLATQKWSHSSLADLLSHWQSAHEIMERDRPYLKSSLLLRYEDLVTKPQITLDTIYQFINMPASPVQTDVQSDLNEHYFRQWESSLDAPVNRFPAIAASYGYMPNNPYVDAAQ